MSREQDEYKMSDEHLAALCRHAIERNSAEIDYQVLEHVRETWSEERASRFERELQLRLTEHYNDAPPQFAKVGSVCRYIAGDYSRAALAAIEKEQQHGA